MAALKPAALSGISVRVRELALPTESSLVELQRLISVVVGFDS